MTTTPPPRTLSSLTEAECREAFRIALPGMDTEQCTSEWISPALFITHSGGYTLRIEQSGRYCAYDQDGQAFDTFAFAVYDYLRSVGIEFVT